MKKLILSLFVMAMFFTTNAQTKILNPKGTNSQEIGLLKASMITVNAEDFTGKSNSDIINSVLELSNDYSFVEIHQLKIDKLGKSHQKFNQYYKGIQVAMGQIIMHYNTQGNVEMINGTYYSIGYVNLSATINANTALNSAIEKLGIVTPMWEDEETSRFASYEKPEGNLVILPSFDDTSVFKLAWKFDVFAAAPQSIRGITYVDAQTNEILFYDAIIKHADNFGHRAVKVSNNNDCEEINSVNASFLLAAGDADTKYSGNRQVETIQDGANPYELLSSPNSVTIRTYDANNIPANTTSGITNIYDPNNNNDWTSIEFTGKAQGELDAHWGAEEVYDYWDQVHGRSSFDDAGASIFSLVHVETNYDNAFWNGSWMSYGDGSSNGNEGNGIFDILTSLDVCAHEIGHAVMTNTANLVYQREPGAMNEGFSDIWAAANEFWSKGNGDEFNPNSEVWLIGDEIDRRTGSIGLRSMSNPNARFQPDTYRGTYWKAATVAEGCVTPTGGSGGNDYCGVHTNSGVLNYWFYLTVVGGSGTNDIADSFSVNGIGMGDAEQITLRMQDVYLTTNSDFTDARSAAIQSAGDLFGTCSIQVETVTNAMYAVGVGNAFNNATEYTGNWSNGTPNSGKVVTISSNYNSASNGGSITACALIVKSGATLTIAAGDFSNITNGILINGTLIIEHEGSLVQVDDAALVTNNGTIQVLKSISDYDDSTDFSIVGSPMSGDTRDGVYNQNIVTMNHITGNFSPNAAVTAFDPGAENFTDEEGDNWQFFIAAEAIVPGVGYLIGGPSGGGNFTSTYTNGTLNNGIITFNTVYNSNQNASPNILSNPYASAINGNSLITNNGVIDAIYYWEHITTPGTNPSYPGHRQDNYDMGDISLYNLSGGVAAANAGGGAKPSNQYIASGQGFGIKANAAGTVTFNNALRVTGNNTGYRNSNSLVDRLYLKIENTTYHLSSSSLIAFTEGATDAYEAMYDAKRLATPVSIYSVLEEKELAIQGRSQFNEDQVIPLGFRTMVEENQTYTISLEEIEGDLLTTATVYLQDNLLNITTNLSEGDYTFTSNESNQKDRFVIVFNEEVLGNDEVSLEAISIYPNPTNGIINIVSPLAEITDVEVYDIRGRKIQNVKVENTLSYQLNMVSLESAMYFVKIDTQTGSVTKRIIKK